MSRIDLPDSKELDIPKTFFADHRKKLLNTFSKMNKTLAPNTVLFFKGVPTIPIHD